MQQETEISYKLAGKLYEVKSGNLCFADISSKAVGLLETSNDTYDMLLNAQQIAELKSEKDWVEIHFCDVKNLRIGYLKQNSAVGTILIFFKNAKPFYIVWSGEEFSPTLANIAANTIADKSLHDIMTKCTK